MASNLLAQAFCYTIDQISKSMMFKPGGGSSQNQSRTSQNAQYITRAGSEFSAARFWSGKYGRLVKLLKFE